MEKTKVNILGGYKMEDEIKEELEKRYKNLEIEVYFIEFRKYCIQHMTGKHSGVDTCTFENRVSYKRDLIKRRKIKLKNI